MTWPMMLAGLPRAGAISKLHDYKQNVQEKKGLLKKWVLMGKQFEVFRQKNSKTTLLPWRTKQKNHKTPRAKIKHEPCSQEEINWSKNEKKSFRIKLLELCKTTTKKSSPDLFKFCKLAWTWHGRWRWQGYHVQAQVQSSMITNRTCNKWKAYWKNEL